MKLLVIIPSTLPLEEIKKDIAPWASGIIREDTQLEFVNLTRGFPTIESQLQGEFNATQILPLAVKAQEEGYDGVFVDCFDDPAVYACRESLGIPVLGAYVPSVLTAMGVAERVGIITTDRPGILSEERKARLMGIEGRVVSVRDAGEDVLSVLEDRERTVQALKTACVSMYEEDRVGAVCLGCTAMTGAAGELRKVLRDSKIPVAVVEPLAAGLSFLEHMACLGLTNSLGTGISLEHLKWYEAEER